MDKTWLGENVFNEMIRPQVEREKYSIGLGWVILNDLSNGEYALISTGHNNGIQTIVVLLPMSKEGIVVFTNGENGNAVYKKVIAGSLDLGEEIITKFFNKQ